MKTQNKNLVLFLLTICLSIMLVFSSLVPPKSANADINCSAKSMVVMETLGGKVLYSKNENEKLPMASTTKIVTAITVIENCDDLDRLVSVPKSATLVEGSSIYLRAGESLSIRDLLYGLMLQSGNDAAETLALSIAGSKEAFAILMNQTAQKAGALNSNFVTPHGLDKSDHYTTALDLAKITAYALKNEDFKQIVSTKSHQIKATEHNTARTLINKNKLLSSLEGCIGVKTGYTKKSGRCLVSACERDGMQVVCVVLNCSPMFEESFDLIQQSYKEYKRFDIMPSYKFVTDIMVEGGKSKSVRFFSKEGFSTIDKIENADRYRVEYEYESNLTAPVDKGQVVGRAKVFCDNNLIFTENLCTIEPVEKEVPINELQNILENW